VYILYTDDYVIDTKRVFLPKCPLTTVRSHFSADDLQIIRGEAENNMEEKTSTGI